MDQLSPLLRENQNLINSCVLNICDREITNTSNCKKYTRTGLNVGAALFSLTAKIFYIPIALKIDRLVGRDISYLSAACNMKAFFILEVWAARRIIADLLTSRSREEQILEADNGSKKTSIIFVSTILALLSQVPIAYPATIYNPKYAVLAGVVTLVTGFLIPTRSIQLSLEVSSQAFSDAKKDAELLKLQTTVLSLVKEKQQSFVRMQLDSKRKFMAKLKLIRGMELKEQRIHEYTKAMFVQESRLNPGSFARGRRCWTLMGITIGYVLTGIFEYATAVYTFSKTKEMIWNNDIGAGLISAFVTASCIYLYGTSIAATSARVLDAPLNWCIGIDSAGLGQQLRPVSHFFLTAIEVCSNFFALGPSIIVWGDFFDQPNWSHWFFEISICYAIYILLLTSSLDTVDEVLQILAVKEEEKEFIKINQEFSQLIRIIEKSPQQYFQRWLLSLPQEIKKEFSQRTGIDIEKIGAISSVYGIQE